MDPAKTFISTIITTAQEISTNLQHPTSIPTDSTSITYRQVLFDSIKSYAPKYAKDLLTTSWESMELSSNPIILIPFDPFSLSQKSQWIALLSVLSSLLQDTSLTSKLSVETLTSPATTKESLTKLRDELYLRHENLQTQSTSKEVTPVIAPAQQSTSLGLRRPP